MRARLIAPWVVLAGAPALAQVQSPPTQSFLMVPRGPAYTPAPITRAIMLFSPQDGSLVDPEFIPGLGAQYEMDFPKDVMQVGAEIWVSDQTEGVILRFDLLGNYVGAVNGPMANIRGMEVHAGVVYVASAPDPGVSPANAVVRFDFAGGYLGAFSVGTGPFDVLFYNGELLVTHGNGPGDITRWGLTGNPLGVFHTGPITLVSQIHRKASNGNVLAAGTLPPTGLYEYEPSGAQVGFVSVSGPRAAYELANGKALYTNPAGVHVYDPATATSATVTTAPGHYINRLTFDPAAAGACCLPSGACTVMTMSACGAQGGTFRGPGTSCVDGGCPPPGACCLPGSCVPTQPQPCADLGGVWYGPGTPCAAGTCLSFLRSTGAPNASFVQFEGSGIFLDLTAGVDLEVRRIDYFPVVANGAPLMVDLYTRPGTYAGFTASPEGWTHTQTVHGVSAGGTINPTRLTLASPISIRAGQTVGVYLVGTIGGARYHAAATTVNNHDIGLVSDTVRSAPFGGIVASPYGFAGTVFYSISCYPDCNRDAQLTIADVACYQTRFMAGDPYADCNGVGGLTIADFGCFQTKFIAGCP